MQSKRLIADVTFEFLLVRVDGHVLMQLDRAAKRSVARRAPVRAFARVLIAMKAKESGGCELHSTFATDVRPLSRVTRPHVNNQAVRLNKLCVAEFAGVWLVWTVSRDVFPESVF